MTDLQFVILAMLGVAIYMQRHPGEAEQSFGIFMFLCSGMMFGVWVVGVVLR